MISLTGDVVANIQLSSIGSNYHSGLLLLNLGQNNHLILFQSSYSNIVPI